MTSKEHRSLRRMERSPSTHSEADSAPISRKRRVRDRPHSRAEEGEEIPDGRINETTETADAPSKEHRSSRRTERSPSPHSEADSAPISRKRRVRDRPHSRAEEGEEIPDGRINETTETADAPSKEHRSSRRTERSPSPHSEADSAPISRKRRVRDRPHRGAEEGEKIPNSRRDETTETADAPSKEHRSSRRMERSPSTHSEADSAPISRKRRVRDRPHRGAEEGEKIPNSRRDETTETADAPSKEHRSSRRMERSPSTHSEADSAPISRKRRVRDRPHRGAGEETPVDKIDKTETADAPSKEQATLNSLKLSVVVGSRYIPPGRLKQMQQQITDKSSPEYQMLSWNALKRSINGIINKSNVANITSIVEELFSENLIRGRGLLAQSIMQAQAFSPVFSQVYACLVAIVNTKLPTNGELILHRLVQQFKRCYKRKNKNECVATVKFIAHLVNQGVVHELLALQVLTLLLETPTDDSIELCIAFLKESGMKLKDICSRAFSATNDTLRNVLHEGKLETRILYMVEVYLKILKDGFKEHPPVIPELDLVTEEDQITHLVSLDDELKLHTELNVFKLDPDFQQNNEKYQQLKGAILGLGGDSDGQSEEGSGESESSDEEKGEEPILDNTGMNEIQFRRTMYLTLMSSINFEETVHKIVRLKLPDGSEKGVLEMIHECACQERSYMKYFGLTAQRLCVIRKPYMDSAELMFRETFATVHRLESNKLRNSARFFAHLFYSDAVPWTSLQCIRLNEEETNASSRIFIKIMFQELAEYMGLINLNARLNQPALAPYFEGLFSKLNPKHSRFSVNFFSTIGLGGLTEGLREHLKALQESEFESSSDSESSDQSSSGDSAVPEETPNLSAEPQHMETAHEETARHPPAIRDCTAPREQYSDNRETRRGHRRDVPDVKARERRRSHREGSRSPYKERSRSPYKERSRSPYKKKSRSPYKEKSRSPYKERRRDKRK